MPRGSRAGAALRDRRPAHRRAGRLRRFVAHPSAVPLLIVTAVVAAANLLYLTGLFDPNPTYTDSGLTVTWSKHVLAGLNQIDPNVGATAQSLGHLAALDWLHGKVPWWNPYEGIGVPLAGEMEAAVFFPPMLLLVFANGQVYMHLILELVAGYSTWFLLRRLVRSRAAATAGAVAFALNGTFSWLFHAAGNPVAFLPLLLLGVEQCLDPGPSRGWRGWPVVATAVALGVYAGFPETAYIDGLMAVVWLAVRASGLRGRELGAALGRAAGGALVGLLAAAPALTSFVSYTSHGYLGAHSAGFGGEWMNAGLALPASVMPYVFGPIFGWGSHNPNHQINAFWSNVGGYLGISVVLLALVGVVGRPNRRLRIALAAWVVLGAARSVGVPVALQVVNAVPGLTRTIFFRYAYPSWSLAVIVLAVLGIDDLAGRRYPRRTAVAAGVALAGAGGGGIEAFRVLGGVLDNSQKVLWAASSIGLAGLVAAACLAFALAPSGRLRRAALSALVMVEALVLFVVPELSAHRHVVFDAGPVRYLQAHLGTARFYTLGPIAPNYGSYWQVGEVAVNDLPIPDTYALYITGELDHNVQPNVFTGTTRLNPAGPSPAAEFAAHLPAYEAIGVRYLVAPSRTALPTGLRLSVAYHDGWATIYELPHPAPMYSASRGCLVIGGTLSSALVQCDGDGTLVRREQYLPGWTASDGSRRLAIRHSGPLFQAVDLHAGRNRVAFRYEPPYTTPATVAAVAALLVIAGAPLSRATGMRRRRPGAPRRC